MSGKLMLIEGKKAAKEPRSEEDGGEIAPQDGLIVVRRALRTSVAARIQHTLNYCCGLLGRKTKQRVFASDEKGSLAGMRIGAVLHPAVCLAFADSVSFEQNTSCPSFVCAEGRAPSPGHQHEFAPTQHETNP
jgi:hypothetical protein